MEKQVKSGKEILDEFFKEIQEIDGIDKSIAKSLADLYSQGKLSDTNIRNELENLRKDGPGKD